MSILDDLGDLGADDAEDTGPVPALAATRARFAGLPNLPALVMLMGLAQWVAWASRRKPGLAKPTKVPINPATGRAASTKDAATWGSYEAAADRARRDSLSGVGFVLKDDDKLTGVDLDNCRDPATGALSPLAAKVLALGETYAEVSPSGCGIRLFALGKVDHPRKDDGAGIEVYGSGRYLTVTGQLLDGAPDTINPAPRTLALLGYHGSARTSPRATRPGVASDSSIIVPEVDLPPPKPSALGRECAAFWQLVEGRRTQREPTWRLMLDLARHTTGGDALAHELSKDHPGYSPEAT